MTSATLKGVKIPWRSVKRAMPNEGQRVIVKCIDGKVRDGYRCADFYGGFSTGPDCGSCITNVTHWVPYR